MTNHGPTEDLERLSRRLGDLRGSTFIESSRFVGAESHLQIRYVQSFTDFKQRRPLSGIRAKDFRLYFRTGAATEKILAIE